MLIFPDFWDSLYEDCEDAEDDPSAEHQAPKNNMDIGDLNAATHGNVAGTVEVEESLSNGKRQKQAAEQREVGPDKCKRTPSGKRKAIVASSSDGDNTGSIILTANSLRKRPALPPKDKPRCKFRGQLC
ncbi:hypothetical protein Salat_1588700 [Sesamum alatum]|uniref:Uncharacterized protein n=1 Tax=Sesamum alatum TaxID=300844 RepID=A0AAE1YDL8_9LAMI|nr:hypothetical protein Salat_1588700 [Sesamum alatum]